MKDVISKERRDTILEILNANYPHGVGEKVIWSLCSEAGHVVDIDVTIRDIMYLEEKKLIKVDQVGNVQYGMKRYICTLTAEGIDALEGVR